MSRWNYLGIALATLAADQLTKAAVVAHFPGDTIIPIIPGLFRLVHVENPGIAFGLFSDSSSPVAGVIFALISAAAMVLIGVLLWQHQPSTIWAGLGLALILGGAAGNLADRLWRGRVVDFLDFYVGSYHWPAFNIADSAICIGAAALLWEFWNAHPARHWEA
jgi:signal peptidase II